MEIERKFLVTDINGLNLKSYKHKHIVQDYVYSDLFTTIRKREITANNKTKYIYTIKTDRKGISVNEIEKEITKDEYDKIATSPKFKQIVKTRYLIPYLDKLIIELDIFEKEYEGLMFAEIEFESEKEAYETALPNWFDKELTNKVSNSMMAKHNKEYIMRKCKLWVLKKLKIILNKKSKRKITGLLWKWNLKMMCVGL